MSGIRTVPGDHPYTRQTLKEKLQNIGQYLGERKAHPKEWDTTIIPLIKSELEKREEKLESFFKEFRQVGII